MTARVRRRPDVERTASREWEAERETLVARAIATGLGTRPPRWWAYDAERPDLATDATGDAYAHLRPAGHPLHRRAADRLRFLVANELLVAGELAAIRGGDGPRYDWRRAVLQEVTP